MLKDKLKKFFNKEKDFDPMKLNIMDGFVDIKGYKVSDDGSKKLVYHDCGDNVVTDWMRHAIMLMLTGDSFTNKGNDRKFSSSEESRNSNENFTMFRTENHSSTYNYDGYLINKEQYFWNNALAPQKYSKSNLGNFHKYALFPTKVLFGTGKEYASWSMLQSENEVANASWYRNMLNSYGGDVDTAKVNFDTEIGMNCNKYSGTIGYNIYSGDGLITPTRTVNDPDTSSNVITNTSTMNKNYGVVGAIKTPYFAQSDEALLQKTITDGGKLLKPVYSGIGRPCFIYFDTPRKEEASSEGTTVNEGWDDETSDVSLSKDSNSKYLNKITFKIVMPSQSASTGTTGSYYPYNGYRLKQMGLYNDANLITDLKGASTNTYPYKNMPCGTLLAVKNITPLDKTAEIELVMTWTLTI